MKTMIIILIILIAVLIAVFLSYQKNAKSVATSQLVEGKLAQCPDKPNCVCSEYKDDSSHYIEPIVIAKDSNVDNVSLLKSIIREMNGQIQVERSDYLAATFASSLFRFVDDLEIRIDSTQGLIHIRSASRVGYSDMGVNKKRVEQLKALFNNKALEADK